jgi:hypothetical protein
MPSSRQILDALVELFVPDIRSAFDAAIQDVTDNAVIKSMIAAIQGGDVDAAFRALGFTPAAMRPLTAAIERAYEQGGVTVAQTFPQRAMAAGGRGVFRFDVRNSRAEAYLRERSSSMVTRLTEETRVNVQTVMSRGVQAGDNPRTTALDIVGRIDRTTGKRVGGIVGLTEQQEFWVSGTRNNLENLSPDYFNRELRDKRYDETVAKAIRDEKPLSAETIEKLVTRYKSNTLRYRGESIARTEALESLNRSEYEAYQQAIDNGSIDESAITKIWDNAGDRRVRHDHLLMEGQKRAFSEPFLAPDGSLLLHPLDRSLGASAKETIMCRCKVRYKIDFFSDFDA